MSYITSHYNLVIDGFDDDCILSNTLTGNIMRFTKKYKPMLLSLNESDWPDYIKIQLIKGGFLIDESFDEKSLIEFNYNKCLYSDKNLVLTIVPTESCNMRCLYCYEKHDSNDMSECDVRALLSFIKTQMSECDNVYILWFGGEPLLRTDIVKTVMSRIQNYSKFYKKIVSSHITTNGTLLLPDVFEELYLLGVNSYQITVDGAENRHNFYRPMVDGSNGFEQIMDNLTYIRKSNKRVSIVLRINVTIDEFDTLLPFVRQINEDFLCDDRFKLQIYNVRDWGGDGVKKLQTTNLKSFNGLLEKLIKEGIDPLGYMGSVKLMSMQCELASIYSYYINYDLSVHKCANTVYDENYLCGRIGQIDSRGSLTLNEQLMAKWMSNNRFKVKCSNCKYYPVCASHSCPYSLNICQKKSCQDNITQMNYKILFLAQSKEIIY